MRRVAERNADIIGDMRALVPTSEQYSVFRAYLDSRHRDGGMADMTVLDYAMMVEDSHVKTRLVEYRRRGPDTSINGRGAGALLAVALTDVLSDGLSMVYSFFDPEEDEPLARHLHDPRPYRAREAHGPALRLSRLLGLRLAQDGLQGALPAAGAADAGRLDTGRCLISPERASADDGCVPARVAVRMPDELQVRLHRPAGNDLRHIGQLEVGFVVANRAWHPGEQHGVAIEGPDAVGEPGVNDACTELSSGRFGISPANTTPPSI